MLFLLTVTNTTTTEAFQYSDSLDFFVVLCTCQLCARMVLKIPDKTQRECVYECNTLETVSKRSAGVTEGRKHRKKSSETLTATRVKAVLKAVSSRQGGL